MSAIRNINDKVKAHHDFAITAKYNLATKLASREAVDLVTEGRIVADQPLHGLMMVQMVSEPLFYATHALVSTKQIVGQTANIIRIALRRAKLKQQLQFLDSNEVKQLVRDELIVRYGDRVLSVRGNSQEWAPRAKWPYLRRLRHMTRADIEDALDVRRAGVSFDQDSIELMEVLDAAARKANSSVYLSGGALEQVF